GAPMLLVALILALCGYGTWYYVSTSDYSRPERVTEVPPELAARIFGQPEGAPASSTSEPLPEAQVAITPDVVPPKPGSASSEAARSMPGPGTTTSTGTTTPAGTATPTGTTTPAGTTTAAGTTIPADPTAALRAEGPHAYGTLDGTARIVIRATSDSWIRI